MLGTKGVLAVGITSAIVDNRTKVVMVMEVGVHLLSTASSTAASAATNRPLVSLLLWLLLVVMLMLFL